MIARNLWIGTEGPRAGDAAGWIAVSLVFRRDNLVRRRALFHPVFQRRRHRLAKAIWAGTKEAMIHSGDHVEPSETLGIFPAYLRSHAFVIVHSAGRRHGSVTPALEQNQLSAPALEGFQIGVGRVESLPQRVVEDFDVAVEVERAIIPCGILKKIAPLRR